MNLTFEDYVKELGIESLSHEDQVQTLTAFAKAVHNQFLLDLYQTVGEDNFKAIKTSIKLGTALYVTTLKHLAPEYMKLFEEAKQKVLEKMRKESTT